MATANELKSFQRISPEDIRYLQQLERTGSRSGEGGRTPANWKNRLRAMAKMVARAVRRNIDKALYEEIPGEQIYSSTEFK